MKHVIGEETGFTDKRGTPIRLGHRARVIDKRGKEWIGTIVKEYGKGIIYMGKSVRFVYCFYSNYSTVLNQAWASEKLEIIECITLLQRFKRWIQKWE